MSRLVVVSNRVGPLSDDGKAGGLAVGLADALRQRGGVWFGWSGETTTEGTFGPLHLETHDDVQLATVDMTASDVEEFYNGYANQALWPVLHYRPDLAQFDGRFAAAYRRVSQRMSEKLRPLIGTDDQIWVHDYHYIPLGAEMRSRGFEGPLGFFLHVPFPAPELFRVLPEAADLAKALFAYDLVGFQTEADRANFCRFASEELGAVAESGDVMSLDGWQLHAIAAPIGIDAERFAALAVSPEAVKRQAQVRASLGPRHLIIGVDRLDYSKGLLERLRAFERLLHDFPESAGKASFLQIAPLSRSDLDPYAELRRQFEELAGRINGANATLDWSPVRMLTRGFARKSLAGLYRASRVGLVTPLRDGMNLVAKEYVAAQDPDDPGVLILSRFAGAANELSEALLVNPHDIAGTAEALQRALHMPHAERRERWAALNETVQNNSAARWCDRFLDQLGRPRLTSGRAAAPGADAPPPKMQAPRFDVRDAATAQTRH